jgi:hypothetical protein
MEHPPVNKTNNLNAVGWYCDRTLPFQMIVELYDQVPGE